MPTRLQATAHAIPSVRKVGELSGGTYRQELHDVAATDEHAIALVMVHAERNGWAIEYRSAEVFHIRGGRATERTRF